MLDVNLRWKLLGIVGICLVVVNSGCGGPNPAANPSPPTVIAPPPVVAPVVVIPPANVSAPPALNVIRYPAEKGAVFAPGTSSLVYCDGKLLDIATGNAGRPLPGTESAQYGDGPFDSRLAISSDGKAVAQWLNPQDHSAHGSDEAAAEVRVYATSSGMVVRKLSLPPTEPGTALSVFTLRFPEPRVLLVAFGSAFDVQLNTYDIVTGQVKDQQQLTGASASDLCISEDGKLYLQRDRDRCYVRDIVAKKVICELELGADFAKRGQPSFGFSPDTTEVAALAGEKFLVWSATTGKPIVDHTIERMQGPNLSVGWVPESRGWTLGGKRLLWRDPSLVVWEINADDVFFGHRRMRFAGPKAILQTDKSLLVMDAPFAEIEQAVSSVRDVGNLIVPPGSAVKMDIQVGQVQHAVAADVAKALQTTVAALLTQQGYVVADQAAVTLHVTHSEKPGEKRQIRDIQTGATGEFVEDTILTFAMSLDAGASPVWNFNDNHAQSTSIGNDRTPAGLRNNSFGLLRQRIAAAPLPPFISKSNASSLPIRTKLDK